jgi:hypothetical protein
MKFEKDLPIIFLEIDMDDMSTGVDAISFVDKPATEVAWSKFNDEQKKLLFKKDEVKRCVTGPIMLADTNIYRVDDAIGEYYCRFTKSTIFNMLLKYQMDGNVHRVNEMHDSKREVKDVYLIENYIVGDRVKSNLYPDITTGSWMGTFYIDDVNYWNKVISKDNFGGFSLEGFFNENMQSMITQKIYTKMKTELLNDAELEAFIEFRIKNILNADLNEQEKEDKIKSLLNLSF